MRSGDGLTPQSREQNCVSHLPPEAGLHFLPAAGHTCTSEGVRELVKDECQELIRHQSHKENAAGSILLDAELVGVYRPSPAPTATHASVGVHRFS